MSSDIDTPTVLRLAEAGHLPSFAAYMDRCLHDPHFGYYGAGRVRFGHGQHFWTYPKRLSPLFGWMVADSLRFLFEALEQAQQLPADVELTVLELGAGDGDLGRDIMDRVQALRDDPAWRALAARLRYVIGERSPQLRERQRARLEPHIRAGRAEVRELDGRELGSWEGPFFGAVLCNELLGAMCCERLRIVAPGEVRRVHVAGTRDGEALDAAALWEALAAGSSGDALQLGEVEVPLALGWLESDGGEGRVPDELQTYLAGLAPLIEDLAACSLLPADLYWSPDPGRFVAGLGALLQGPERRGLALDVEYGGTSRHVLDPRATVPHLRVYGEREELAHRCEPYVTPGALDITWDVDFTELARLVEATGLRLCHYGHQCILEASTVDLWSEELRPLVVAGRVAEGYPPGEEAEIEAERLVGSFREAAGFRTAIIAPPGFEVPVFRFGPGDPLDGAGLETISPAATPEQLAAALAPLELQELAPRLLSCCDVVANLNDLHHYHRREEVLSALRAAGLLVGAGGCAAASG